MSTMTALIALQYGRTIANTVAIKKVINKARYSAMLSLSSNLYKIFKSIQVLRISISRTEIAHADHEVSIYICARGL